LARCRRPFHHRPGQPQIALEFESSIRMAMCGRVIKYPWAKETTNPPKEVPFLNIVQLMKANGVSGTVIVLAFTTDGITPMCLM
jgi:hypothetical protein